MHTCTHAHMHAHTHAHTHARTQTHTHTHTLMQYKLTIARQGCVTDLKYELTRLTRIPTDKVGTNFLPTTFHTLISPHPITDDGGGCVQQSLPQDLWEQRVSLTNL